MSASEKQFLEHPRLVQVEGAPIGDQLTKDRSVALNIAAGPSLVVQSFAGDTAAVIRDMRIGTHASVIPHLAKRLGISQVQLFDLLRLPRNVMKNRISKNGILAPFEQDRIYRADRVWARAMAVLEDETAARAWIGRPNRSLGGETPLSLLDTEVGYELVLDTLGRIEYGIVS